LGIAVVALAIGWFVVQQAQTSGWKGWSIPGLSGGATQPPPPRGNQTIRIATFNIQVFGESKLNEPEVMQTIVAILKNFDLIAIQEVRSITQALLPHLIALLNAEGKYHYDYAIGPRLGPSNITD